jgi:2-iminoacetate synthase ThiH
MVVNHAMDSVLLAPDLQPLRDLSTQARELSLADLTAVLGQCPDRELTLEELSGILHTLLSPNPENRKLAQNSITLAGARVRNLLYGNAVVAMAPIEVSNACASDCQFCGWRSSNRAMKRIKMDVELALIQVEYLLDLGIHWIEFVSGDDFQAVRQLIPELIVETRKIMDHRGIHGKISFCTMALTQEQYAWLRSLGADNTIVWQETYDPAVYQNHVLGGPKARGIQDDWKLIPQGDGCAFRIDSQRRALEADLEVGLGAMLGLSDDLALEFLATVDHARRLQNRFSFNPERPMIIGMPVWNAITTKETDLRPARRLEVTPLFPALAALYLLSVPSQGTWVFPNCRVPLATQVEAARVAGAFSSTEVKLGPGGYFPSIIAREEASGRDAAALRKKITSLLREADPEIDLPTLSRLLDEREQFQHHYHSHQRYNDAMSKAGLKIQPEVVIEHRLSGAC